MCYATEQTEATNVAFMLQFIRVFSVVFGIVLLGKDLPNLKAPAFF